MPIRRPANLSRQLGGLLVLTLALLGAACSPEADQRTPRLLAIARWQDVRLAPLDSLTTMLEAPDAHVRLAATRAAGLIGRDDIGPRLLERLADRSLTVRTEACFALGVLGDTLAVPALETATTDAKAPVRLAALRGLAQVPNRGAALLAATTAGEPTDAAAAWDALRNQSERVPRAELLQALQAGLTSAEPAVLWRVLRCAERLPDSTLVPLVVPHTRNGHDQVRVHAYRALARLGGPDARAAILATCQDGNFASRARARVAVAACRALGTLGADATDEQLPAIAVYLIEQAGAPSAHLAQTALEAMTALVVARPLPPEAARQESLLPVWRIRLARAARGHLDDRDAGPRAAAATAWAALRGAGGLEQLVQRLDLESEPYVQAALIGAAMGLDPTPGRYLVEPGAAIPPRGERSPLVEVAMIDAFVGRAADLAPSTVDGFLAGAALTDNPVGAATATAHLGAFPGNFTAAVALAVGRYRPGPWRSDLVLAALGSVSAMWAVPDSVWSPPDSLSAAAAAFLRRCSDDPDLRIRLEARRAALATGLLPANLVASEPSLRATLPAVVRDPAQPPVALPGKVAKVRGTTAAGKFEITLKGDLAPNTCAMFLHLVRSGFYDGLTFHRVVPDFVVQGGDPTGTGWGGPGYSIRSEWSPQPYTRGTVGIAHSGKDTGGCQWFVTLSEQPHLVGRYTVFGEVTGGMDVFDVMQPGDTFSLDVIE